MPRTTAEIAETLRTDLSAASSVPLDFDNPETLESALVTAVAQTAEDVETAAQVVKDATSADTAVDGSLTAIARGQGIDRRPATSSRYSLGGSATSITLSGGEIVRGGGPAGRTEWRVITTGAVNPALDPIVVEAVEPGPTALPSGTTNFEWVTTVPGSVPLTWISGSSPAGQVGRARETDPELAARIRAGGRGLRASIRNLDWIVAAPSIATTSPGTIAIAIAPAPVGSDQEQELVDTIGPYTIGITTTGSSSGTFTPDGGPAVTVSWTAGSTEDVDIVVVLTLASGVAIGSVSAGVEESIRGYFTTLEAGDVVIRNEVIGACLDVAGVVDVTTCTLDGSATNYTPSVSTNIAIPGTFSVS